MPNGITPSSLVELINIRCTEAPNRSAFLFLENGDEVSEQINYEGLQMRVRQLAAGIQCYAARGDRVLIMLPPGINYICMTLACFYAGTILIPLYPLMIDQVDKSLALLEGVVKDSGAKLLITEPKWAEIMQSFIAHNDVLKKILFTTSLELLAKSADWHDPKATPSTLALLMYTSGSTGTPKGVMLSHGNLLHNAKIFAEGRITPSDIFCAWVPPYHISGLFSGIIMPIYLGTHNVTFSPQRFLENPLRWPLAIHRYHATVSGAPTFAYDVCARALANTALSNINLSEWHTAVIGGEAIRKDVLDRFLQAAKPYAFQANAIYSMFGLTESTMLTTGNQRKTAPTVLSIARDALQMGQMKPIVDSIASCIELISSGQPLLDMEVKIVDPNTFTVCPDGQVGEVWITGPSVAQGYWQQSDLTKETFQAYLADTQQGPYLRSGDLGSFHEGELFITGRLKEIIIIRGINYYPEDIENTVRASHPDLLTTNCAAFATETPEGESLVVAFEYPKPKQSELLTAIFSTIRASVAKTHGLQVYGFVVCAPGEIPKTITQKIQRKACQKKVSNNEWFMMSWRDILPTVEQKLLPRLLRNELLSYSEARQLLSIQSYLQQLISQLCAVPLTVLNELCLHNKPISHVGLDSINIVKLITEIKTELGITVPVAKFYDTTTLVDICEMMVAKLKSTDNSIVEDDIIDVAVETKLPDNITICEVFSNQSAPIFLLTGATGFLGGYLLKELLQQTSARIICLVRAKNPEAALERIMNNLKAADHWQPDYLDRIEPLPGNLEQSNFGLAPNIYQDLAHNTTAIFHCAAAVNFVAPYTILKEANVTPLIRLLEFAGTSHLKPLHFISTLGIFNMADRHLYPIIKESEFVMDCNQIFGSYAQSKAIAEILCQQARQRGFPINIYRPGLISGDSQTGYCNTEDFLCRLIKGCLQLGHFPQLDLALDMSPVDYVSQAIVALANDSTTINQTYHLANPTPISFNRFLDWLENDGHTLKRLIPVKWQEILENIKEDNALYPLLPFLKERHTTKKLTFFELFTQGKNPLFDTAQTSRKLATSTVTCHPVDDELLRTYFAYFTRTQFLTKS